MGPEPIISTEWMDLSCGISIYLVLRESAGHKKTGIFPGGKGKCWVGFGNINFETCAGVIRGETSVSWTPPENIYSIAVVSGIFVFVQHHNPVPGYLITGFRFRPVFFGLCKSNQA